MCNDNLEVTEVNLERIICEVISIANVSAINNEVKLFYSIDERINYNLFADVNKLRYVILNSVQYVISSAARNAFVTLNAVVASEHGPLSCVSHGSNSACVKFEITNSMSRCESYAKLIRCVPPVPSIEDELINSNNIVRKMGGGKIHVVENKNPDYISINFCLNFIRGALIPGIKPDEIGDTAAKELEDIVSCSILLVEDNYSNARIVIELLTSYYEHKVNWVENGALAIEAVKNADYDVILMDIQMPVMDGFEATRCMRASGCNVPIIALTAAIMPWAYDECINCGMDAFISKPIGIKKLGLLIKNTIEKRRVQISSESFKNNVSEV